MDTSSTTLWGIHAGKDSDAERIFIVNGYVGLGWPEMGNLGLLSDDWEEFKTKLKVTYPGLPDMSYITNTTQLHHFVHEVAIGHAVAFRPKLVSDGGTLIFLGRVVGPYLYNPYMLPAYPNIRRVEWQRTVPWSRFSENARRTYGTELSIFQITRCADEFLAALAESK